MLVIFIVLCWEVFTCNGVFACIDTDNEFPQEVKLISFSLNYDLQLR